TNYSVMNNWRSLNNISDKILISDFYDNEIDIIEYDSDWNIPSDYSAELVNPVLNNSDKSNWKAVQPGSPGKTNPSFAIDKEISLSNISIVDSVEINENISFSCVAKNIGQTNISEIILDFYIDENLDSIYSIDEKHFTINKIIELSPDESTIIEKIFSFDKPGFFDVKFFTNHSINYFETLKIKYSEVPIILNEIMATPNSEESEWIELVNISDEKINLRGWEIGDRYDYEIIANGHLILDENRYLIISKDNNVMGNYPNNNGIFQAVDIPNLNTYDDKVRLKDFCGNVLDTMSYGDSLSAKNEISFERKGEVLDRTWGLCEDEYGGTPGKENSLLKNTYSIETINDNEYFYFDSTGNFILQVKNNGYENLNDLEMQMFFEETEVFSDSINSLNTDDTIAILISENLDFPDGLNNYEIKINSANLSFTDSILVFKSFTENQIYLNEVLFDPNTLYEQVEFIEFYLPQKKLNTDFWKLQVNNKIEELNFDFNSEFVVITKDTILQNTFPTIEIKYMERFPILTNDGALLKIIDPSGMSVDSVDLREYDEIESGVSLEKSYQTVSSENKFIWKRNVSANGFSPGIQNSITADSASGDKITITPEIFLPAKATTPLEIKIESKIGMSFVELKIYDLRGRKIYSDEVNSFSQPTIKIFWNGKTDYGYYPTIGLYLVFVRVTDVNDKKHEYKKTLVVGD
ncbi:MAG: lamin tail domain-containing protein, partial [Candidatus Marinimicrobia bacterium]|nr:lamin tail domain-containing protein [Candidatus Neomarinimicrobiota bacterium]